MNGEKQMKELDTLKMINSTVFDTVQQLRESKALADIHKLQESNTTTEECVKKTL